MQAVRLRWANEKRKLLIALVASAQTDKCKSAKSSPESDAEGIFVRALTLDGPWGTASATVLLPKKDVAAGGVVFSHWTVNQNGAVTDMLPLAITLARAGAAVILLHRELVWPPRDRTTNREGAVVYCAATWLATNGKVLSAAKETVNEQHVVIRNAFGYVGPRVCDPTVTDDCRYDMPHAPLFGNYVWVPVGETEGGDNTDSIIRGGGLGVAGYLQRRLGLQPISALVGGSTMVQ